LGIGDWGLGIGPNPQSPIPNPHIHILPDKNLLKFIKEDLKNNLRILNFIILHINNYTKLKS
jgi:hypothetical protein